MSLTGCFEQVVRKMGNAQKSMQVGYRCYCLFLLAYIFVRLPLSEIVNRAVVETDSSETKTAKFFRDQDRSRSQFWLRDRDRQSSRPRPRPKK